MKAEKKINEESSNEVLEVKKDAKVDALYEEAVAFVRSAECTSAARLQRGMGIGYSHAVRLIGLLEREGVVGPKREGHVLREVLLSGNSNGTIA